ncbi:MAG: hypothetical protein SOT81_09125 [Treponema sp.]|nr:hypothetical protein [Treponema sp.]
MPDDKYKSISGRKVFFINPTISIENFVIGRLQTMEYEVYVLKDYRTAKSLFAEIQEGICFVCPDAGLSKTGWHNFIKYFENNIVFKNFDFGIFSESIAENKKAEITRDLKLTAGFFSMLETEELVRELVKSLDKLSAKGMRKYVRVSCMDATETELYWFTKQQKMFRAKLLDISNAGIAVKLNASLSKEVFVNQLISDATLILAGKQVPVSVKVTGIKAVSGVLLVIMMYGMDTHVSTQNQIRTYVTEKLKSNLEAKIKNVPLDKTNYENMEI